MRSTADPGRRTRSALRRSAARVASPRQNRWASPCSRRPGHAGRRRGGGRGGARPGSVRSPSSRPKDAAVDAERLELVSRRADRPPRLISRRGAGCRRRGLHNAGPLVPQGAESSRRRYLQAGDRRRCCARRGVKDSPRKDRPQRHWRRWPQAGTAGALLAAQPAQDAAGADGLDQGSGWLTETGPPVAVARRAPAAAARPR